MRRLCGPIRSDSLRQCRTPNAGQTTSMMMITTWDSAGTICIVYGTRRMPSCYLHPGFGHALALSGQVLADMLELWDGDFMMLPICRVSQSHPVEISRVHIIIARYGVGIGQSTADCET